MSNWREQFGDDAETKALADWLMTYYHYPVLVVFVGFAFWNRVRNYSNFIVDGEIFYSGNDPWYHMRSTEYVIANFPETMPFDPWTYFPVGNFTGQFGTIFDQVIALVALLVGLGAPSEYTARFVILIAPAFFGALVCIPVYLIGRRLGGRFGGILGVMFVAFAPDRLLEVSLAGHVQHHAAEVLMLGFALFAFMIAIRAAETELPVHELVLAQEFGIIRETLVWSMIAGVALGIYMWVWPPGAWMFGIIGVFFVVHMMAEHLRGRSPEHTAFVGVTSFTTAALMQLGNVRTLEFAATDRSLVQPGLGLVVAAGLIVMVWLSREISSRNVSPLAYPGAIIGAGIAGLVVMAVALPSLFSFFMFEFNRVFGASLTWIDSIVWFTDIGMERGAIATIGEGRPGELEDIRSAYQFGAFTAFLGALILLFRQTTTDRPKGEELFLVVVSVFLVIATFTQIRFAYYLVLVVAALNAALVGFTMRLAGSPDSQTMPENYQILTVAVIVMVMFVPLLGMPVIGGGQTAYSVADDRSQPGSVMGWSDSLDWMESETPQPGQFADPDGEPMEYYGQYERTDDFEYPDGAYGVLSWWDYGHWITAKGERIPNANPFQQGANEAAEFLLAQNEDTAMNVLETEFDESADAQTRYVMVDSLMVESDAFAGGKFFAPPDFHDDFERGDFYRTVVNDFGQQEATIQTQRYYESMMVRLYHFHGSAQSTTPFVTQWSGQDQPTEEGNVFVETPGDQPVVQFLDNMSQAEEWTELNETSQIGGLGIHPEEDVEALEHFRLVHADEVPAVPQTGGNDQAFQDAVDRGLSVGPASVALNRNIDLLRDSGGNQTPDRPAEDDLAEQLDFLFDGTPAFTKTFERVPGATLQGETHENITANVSPGDEVDIAVNIDQPNGESFVYAQHAELDENLEFEVTVPYSTMGYDEWGVEEGYTNVSARSIGGYEIRVGDTSFDQNRGVLEYKGDSVNVTEAQVIGEDPEPVEVVLDEGEEEFDLGLPDIGTGNGDADDGDDGNGDADDGENGAENGDATNGEDGDGDDAEENGEE